MTATTAPRAGVAVNRSLNRLLIMVGTGSPGMDNGLLPHNEAVWDVWLWPDHRSGEEFGQADETKESYDAAQLGSVDQDSPQARLDDTQIHQHVITGSGGV